MIIFYIRMFKGLKQKFSKKMLSIGFLLLALFIALFLGSYKFLVVDSPANLPLIMESLDNMKTEETNPSTAAPAASPTASPSTSNSREEQVSKILAKYMEKNAPASASPAPAAQITTTTTP
jgi:hypothetical protein